MALPQSRPHSVLAGCTVWYGHQLLGDCTRASVATGDPPQARPGLLGASTPPLPGLGAGPVLLRPLLPALPAMHVDCALGWRPRGARSMHNSGA